MSDQQFNFFREYGSEIILGIVGITGPLLAFLTVWVSTRIKAKQKHSELMREKLELFFNKLILVHDLVATLTSDTNRNPHRNLTNEIESALPTIKPEGYLYFGMRSLIDLYIKYAGALARMTPAYRMAEERINDGTDNARDAEIRNSYYVTKRSYTSVFDKIQSEITKIGKKEIGSKKPF